MVKLMLSQKPSPFEVLTKLLLPALSLTAFILAELRGQQKLLRPLLGLVFVFVVIGFWPSIWGWILKWTSKVQQRRLARELVPELRRLAETMVQFIDPSFRRGSINSVLSEENPQFINQINLPTLDLFYGPWSQLTRRLSHAIGTTAEFVDAALELDSLIRSYLTYCVLAVFDRMPDAVRTSLSAAARRELAVHRENIVLYLREYVEFYAKVRALLPESVAAMDFRIPRPLP